MLLPVQSPTARSVVAQRLMAGVAGAMWWQWDATDTHVVLDGGDLQVAYQDTTFQDVITPSSQAILQLAAATVDGCSKVNQPTATAGRRLLGVGNGRRAMFV